MSEDVSAVGELVPVTTIQLTPEERAEFRRQWNSLYLRNDRPRVYFELSTPGGDDARIRRLFEERQG